ncbi:outer membrane beta-barrel protein [Vibrio cholerae]|uniref:outer membrane beta-barrel protein n=1 Tax=Vibrio cholerae TaxID=666 RepID=UPI0020CD2169|nr:outer membrane beta-barrel protein [Vibrio cholerae]
MEARYSTSVQRSSGVNIDNLSAAFVKLNLPMSAQVSLYGLAGYSYFSLDKQGVGSVDESGFSSGIGIHYALDSRSAIAFDFINHANGDEARLNTVNLSFQLKF